MVPDDEPRSHRGVRIPPPCDCTAAACECGRETVGYIAGTGGMLGRVQMFTIGRFATADDFKIAPAPRMPELRPMPAPAFIKRRPLAPTARAQHPKARRR